MAASPPPKPGRIFIRYRRGETAYAAGWLYDRLADHYGDGQVFKDVDSIELGDDFVEVINGAVGSCDVLTESRRLATGSGRALDRHTVTRSSTRPAPQPGSRRPHHGIRLAPCY
jgi:hypothetical protein